MVRGAAVAAASGAMLVVLAGAAAKPSAWAIGRERQISPGVYATLVYERSGWRIWKTSTVGGDVCTADKGALGMAASVPLGVGSNIYGPTPRLQVSNSVHAASVNYEIVGKWGQLAGEFRLPGDRFFRPLAGHEAELRAARRVEVQITTWEYPALSVGMAEDRGVIDLAGIGDAMSALGDCIDDVK